MKRLWLPAAAGFIALTIAITYPLALHLRTGIPHDAGDPVLNTWLLWWSTQTLPATRAWWDAPMFYPTRDAMALSELLIGLLPITAPVQWLTGSPLAAYNTAFLLSFPLCGIAAYLLAFELTRRRDAAWLAGLAFAFGPYRMNQLAHLQMLSYYWAPIVLLALHRYLRVRRTGWLAVFASAWLMQALVNGYAMFHVSVLIALWLIWFVRFERTLWPIFAAWAVAALPMLPLLLKYRAVHDRLNLSRDINEIRLFSADLASFLYVPDDLVLWGGRLLTTRYETAIFPGATMLVFAAAGLALFWGNRARLSTRWSMTRRLAALAAVLALGAALSVSVVGPWSLGPLLTVSSAHKPLSIAVLALLIVGAGSPSWQRAWQHRSVAGFYLAAAAAMYILALGPSPTLLGREVLYEPPYAWLLRLPGFESLRAPARFVMVALLCQALLLALLFARWAARSHARPALATVLVSAGLLADGWIRLPIEREPEPGPRGWTGVTAVLEAPPGGPGVDFPALYRSMSSGTSVVNGWSGYYPPHYAPLVWAVGRGDARPIHELAAASGPIGVSLDKRNLGNRDIEAAVARLPSARRVELHPDWGTYIVSSEAVPPAALGSRLAVSNVTVNRQPQDAGRMLDARVDTGWGSGARQDGTEEVIVDLGESRRLGAVVLSMAHFAFGFPRELWIDVSADTHTWQTAWSGPTAAATVRAALADPERVPLTFEIGGQAARFLRLRQTAPDEVVPWWIAEVEVYGPP